MPRGTEARAAAGLAGLAGLCVFALVALPNPHARLLLGAASLAPAQLGFIGGAGVEGGQGNSDSIYGSHDDHATFGVAGSGWQGPGNGEAPGDLWNPAVGPRPQPYAGMKQQRRTAGAQGGLVSWFGGGRGLWSNTAFGLAGAPHQRLNMGDLPVPIGYDGDRDRVVPGSNIHMYEHGVPTTIPFDVDDLSPYVVPSYSDPNF